MKLKLFSYNLLDTPIHRMSGLSKLICFLLLTFTIMFTYDIRIIAFVMVVTFALLRVSRIQLRHIRLMLGYLMVFLLLNFVFTFLFSPEEGVAIYGTRHELVRFSARYAVTLEQLVYQCTKLVKYISMIPLGLIFLFTTNPSELASSLGSIGVPYKAACAVALTLRYFPDVLRDYTDISLAQQARGLDLSPKARLKERVRGALQILMPLIFSSLDRIELVSNAMDLRGFGKNKRRTWYTRCSLRRLDWLAICFCAAIFACSLLVTIFVNGSRFYNPFV